MLVPLLRMCGAKCKRIYTGVVILTTATLVIYALFSIGKDDDKVDSPEEILNTRRRGDDFMEILDKVKERIVGDDDDVNIGEIEIAKDLNDKLFKENEAYSKDEDAKSGGGVGGCDACGEVLEDVPIPYTSTPAPERRTPTIPSTNNTRQDGKSDSVRADTEGKDMTQFKNISSGSLKGDPGIPPAEAKQPIGNQKQVLDKGEHLKPYEKRTDNKTAKSERLALIADITREQKKRKAKLQHACKISPYLKYQNLLYRDTLQHLFVVDSQKLLFCYIPKVGCSNWKRLLMVLAGRRASTEGISSKEAHSRNGITRFGSLSMAQQMERLLSYRKVMFVREPFTRIISAFKNKYRDMDVFRAAPDYLKQVARRIMKKYRSNPTSEDLATGENITWAEFTDYLTDPAERPQFDEHWKESFKLCSPCKIKYDFIGKLENMEEEGNYVLQNFNFTRHLSYPSSTNSHPTNSASTNISDYFVDFTNDKLQALWTIYRIDYALFDYRKPKFIP